MSQLFLMTSLLNSLMFSIMKHPMSMGITLLSQTVLISLITNNISQMPWFSYILFLVFLGGMMVLFIYMTSVASNELFLKNKYLTMLIMVSLIITLTMLVDPTMLINNTPDTVTPFLNMTTPPMSSMFNHPNMIMTIFSVMYLFLTLIVVVFMTKSNEGALRSKN